ncbi:SbcC/MukB-like Walker B domain-containing protein [Mangrovibacterium marinum]|uniref:Exonuclease SbcC n=1 Tax=Mangrovibacterium marinum TaxID=1639118 RepID=A0A2T5C478_9BACT|nr:SMC family ATPase [Mangrovibacterium marinum]PTN09630.1 exonuclease SbcC [Mangrovibacterium marinum]
MIPIKLTIQGLYSYQEKQTIDFTKLTAANLFGIFGSVGSGKSSILEAITFALYGKTDRLNLSGDNRNYNMMNLKSAELLIDFIFETGKEQTAYRAVVQGRRNSKRFEDVKKLDRVAYQKQDEEWIPIEATQLEKAIGLSYDNFKRTIIIPQGQFQEFLQLGNKDRTQMMKELFNLEKFEMYGKVAALEQRNNAQRQHLDGQLQQLGEVDPAQLAVLTEQLKQLNFQLKQQVDQLAGHQKKETEMSRLFELNKKLAQANSELTALKQREPEFKTRETKIAKYEQCLLDFKPTMDALENSSKRMTEKARQIEQSVKQLQADTAAIKTFEAELAKLKPDYEKRDELKQKADELNRISRIKELDEQIHAQSGRLEKGATVLKAAAESVKLLQEERKKRDLELKQEKEKLPDLKMLADVKAWHIAAESMKKQTQETEKQCARYQAEEKAIAANFRQLIERLAIPGVTATATVEANAQILKDRIENIRKELKTIEKEAEEIRLKSKLQAFAEGLTDGAPCPLCGSLHHPDIYSTESSDEQMLNLKRLRESKEKEIEQINQFLFDLKDLDRQQKAQTANRKEWSEKLTLHQQAATAHEKLFVWPGYRDFGALQKSFQEAEMLQTSIKKRESEIEVLAQKLEKATKDESRFKDETDRIKNQIVVFQTERTTWKSQLRLLNLADFDTQTPALLQQQIKALNEQYARIEKQFTELTEQLAQRNKQRDTLSGSHVANQKELDAERANHRELTQKLAEKLSQSTFENEKDVRDILAQQLNLNQEKQQLNAFRERLTVTEKQAQQLRSEIGDRVYNAEEHAQMQTAIVQLTEQIKQQNQDVGKLTEKQKKLEKDIASQASLRKEMESLNQRAENIKVMKSLFKASGFVNYISSVYLQNLCNAANDRFFQLSRQKLSLEITEDNNFELRDFMNGGKLRSVKTLSGGQTFQAALSLALALADNIQKITESNQNFFFLDEGFGSLDKESLAVVFETLKSLRKENRIVGVISHVEEMQQEIDVHLRINNNDEKGSIIHQSWTE